MPFSNPVMGGQNFIRPVMQSPNFSLADKAGWAVYENGDAIFYSITATGSVTATTLIADGPGAGVFVYDGGPAPDTLIVAIAAAAGTDAYGNTYSGPGITVSAPGPAGGKNEIQVRPDLNAVLIYAS